MIALLVVAALHRGHSVESLDVRTYVQMMRGVAERGLPAWDNGPLDRFPLVVPHAAPARGLVWGIYSPLYPYLFAPVFRLFGLARVSSLTFALLAPIAVATFALARRFVRDEWYALGPAVLAIVSTPLLGKSLELTAFPLAVLTATLGVYFAVRLASGERSATLATLMGLSWGLATAAHVLTFPMGVASFVVLARDRRALAVAVAAFAVTLLPVCLLNHVRFGSYNPVSYGPPPWCGPAEMSVAAQAAYGLPVAAFATAIGAALLGARQRRVAQVVVVAAAVALLWLIPVLRERGARYVALLFGYVVDVGSFDLNPWIYTHEEGPASLFIGGRANKAGLQATPIALFAAVAVAATPRGRRGPLLALLAPPAALFASLLTRANMDYTDALGFPWVHHRYVLPALPALLVGASVVVERLQLSRRAMVAASALAPLLTLYYWNVSDHALVKRGLLLALPLVAAFGGALAAFFALRDEASSAWRRAAAALTALALVLGVGAGLGHDLRAHYETKRWTDDTADAFAAAVPPRFALLGTLGDFEALLTTAATHDVRYAETRRFPAWGNGLRELTDLWRSEGRAVFLQTRAPPACPWPDVKLVPVPGVPDVLRLEFADVVPKAP